MGGRLKNFGVVLVGLVTLLLCESAALGSPTETIQGKVTGQFASASGCLGCGDMTRYVKADRVWCAWQGDNVIIHARFRNASIEHVTVSWHPSYIVRGGG